MFWANVLTPFWINTFAIVGKPLAFMWIFFNFLKFLFQFPLGSWDSEYKDSYNVSMCQSVFCDYILIHENFKLGIPTTSRGHQLSMPVSTTKNNQGFLKAFMPKCSFFWIIAMEWINAFKIVFNNIEFVTNLLVKTCCKLYVATVFCFGVF